MNIIYGKVAVESIPQRTGFLYFEN